jgi:hypothetical protein
LYIRDAAFGDENIDAGWLGRQGIALALHSAADVLRTKDLPVVMTFLISRALVRSSTVFLEHETCFILPNACILDLICLLFVANNKTCMLWCLWREK